LFFLNAFKIANHDEGLACVGRFANRNHSRVFRCEQEGCGTVLFN
jgi:hypothetical protein